MRRAALLFFSFFFMQSIFSAEFSRANDLFEYPQKMKLDKLNRRSNFPIGINAYGLGPIGGLALTADFFLTPKVALEVGAGVRNFDLDNGFTIGVRYHVFGKTLLNLTPYVGLYTAFHHNGTNLQNNSVYVPVGLHKIKKNGFSWSAEVAWQRNTFMSNGWSGGFRLGYRFKTGKGKR
jgi:hypothetical protein